MVPYGVLARSDLAQVLAVATQDGPVTMRPALRIRAQATTAQFDLRFPQGADYVIVPALVKRADPAVLAWLGAQADKGATFVSICDGALVLANAGMLDGRQATAHWASQSLREHDYPTTIWRRNVRYLADDRYISSAGISAAIPTSLALVEAIGGRAAADALAASLGAGDWGPAHASDRFRPKFGVNLRAFAATLFGNRWLHGRQRIGIPIGPGVDEVALALTADAWSRTGRSQAVAIADGAAPIYSRDGLELLAEPADGQRVDRRLGAFAAGRPALALDVALAGIAAAYGRSTAKGVALDFEYPGFPR
jgi:putative intracellular protease/amidase